MAYYIIGQLPLDIYRNQNTLGKNWILAYSTLNTGTVTEDGDYVLVLLWRVFHPRLARAINQNEI